MRIGIAHHYGWAVAVTAGDDHAVVDRRRIELIGPGVPAAPVHHRGGAHALHADGPPLDDDELATLVAQVRASVVRATDAALDELAASLAGPVRVLAVRAAPAGLPSDIATLRRPPHESRADSAMYTEVLAAAGRARGWTVHRYEAGTVEAEAARLLGDRAHEVLHGPRARLGPPWSKDHRTALAATVVAGATARQDDLDT